MVELFNININSRSDSDFAFLVFNLIGFIFFSNFVLQFFNFQFMSLTLGKLSSSLVFGDLCLPSPNPHIAYCEDEIRNSGYNRIIVYCLLYYYILSCKPKFNKNS